MEKKLERNAHNKMIAGVASGLSDYLEVDVTVVRIGFILLAAFGFSGVLIYIIMCIVMPERSFLENYPNFDPDYKVQDAKFDPMTTDTQSFYPPKKKNDNGRLTAGLILIIIGTGFMLNELDIIPDWFSIFKLWPIVLIAVGLLFIVKSGKKKGFEPPKQKVSNMDLDNAADGNPAPDNQPLT